MPRTTIRHHARQLPPDSVDEDNLLSCLRNYFCHEPLPTRSPAIKALVAGGAFCDGNNAPYSFQSRLPHQSSSSETHAITLPSSRPPSKNVSCTLFAIGQQDEGLQISRLGAFCPPKIIGAEGQSRTDTGSPPPVFELVAVRTTSAHQPLGSRIVPAMYQCVSYDLRRRRPFVHVFVHGLTDGLDRKFYG